MKNFRQVKAIEANNKKKWLAVNPFLTEQSGIYILTRVDENGIKYAYIGQAKHILTRLAQHLAGYQHIDLSLKKHGLFYEGNKYGWAATCFGYPEEELDEREKQYIADYAKMGYQLRNKTGGGQGEGKTALDVDKKQRGYYDGKKQGYEDCRKYVSTMFEKYLNYEPKSSNKIQQRKADEFTAFLKGDNND